jgi:RNA polymerase sigma factor (sigma-70 family)
MATPANPQPNPGGNPGDVLRQAIEQHYPKLLTTILILVCKAAPHGRFEDRQEHAIDVLDEAVRRALLHADQFDPNRSVVAWLRGIAIHVLQDEGRAAGRDGRCVSQTRLGDTEWESALDSLWDRGGSQLLDNQLDQHEQVEQLRQVIQTLPDIHRQVLDAHFGRNLSGVELARELGCRAGTARTRLSRALQVLRERFVTPIGEVAR